VSTTASLTGRLRADCESDWQLLHEHAFVRGLADATLPPDAFRFYLEQNLQYLPEYARAMALGASHADDLATIRVFAADLANVVEVEIPENEELLRRTIELGARDHGGAQGMAPATLAYTSFLVAAAARGGPLEIMAAILPCAWSYAEIAGRLAGEIADHPVYTDWVGFYLTAEVLGLVHQMRDSFDQMFVKANPGPDVRWRLGENFVTSSRLEGAFWEMAYTLDQWPDLAGGHPGGRRDEPAPCPPGPTSPPAP